MVKRILFLLLVFFGFSLIAFTQSNVRGDSGFAGSETCKGCHKDSYATYAKSVHAKKAISGLQN